MNKNRLLLIISIVLINDDAIIDDSLKTKDYSGSEYLIKRKDLPKLIKTIEKRIER